MYEVDGLAFARSSDSSSGSSSSALSVESFRRLDWREEREIRWLFLRESETEMASGTDEGGEREGKVAERRIITIK